MKYEGMTSWGTAWEFNSEATPPFIIINEETVQPLYEAADVFDESVKLTLAQRKEIFAIMDECQKCAEMTEAAEDALYKIWRKIEKVASGNFTWTQPYKGCPRERLNALARRLYDFRMAMLCGLLPEEQGGPQND